MVYFSLFLFGAILSFLELSFLPFFQIFNSGPFLLIPFLVLLSVRYKGYSHLFLALVFGLIFDFAAFGIFGTFTLVFLLTVLVGRIFFFRETSYETTGSFLSLLLISSILLYASQLYVLYQANFQGWQNFLIIVGVGLLMTLVSGMIIYRLFGSYVDWLNKRNDERNR